MAKEMSRSLLNRDMIEMQLPNNSSIHYPVHFVIDAVHYNKYTLFVSKGITSKDSSVLAATTDTGVRAILVGKYDMMVKKLLEVPWREETIITSDGKMYTKIAPSHDSLMDVIASFKKIYK